MIEKLKIKKITYLFNIIALIILVGTVAIYTVFQDTSGFIQDTNIKANIGYIDNITTNIANRIKDVSSANIYETLKKNKKLRDELESSLELFTTNKYRYVYLLDRPDKSKDTYRFLLDGATNIDDKSEFGEEYTPLNMKEWNKVCQEKKPIYFKHTDVKSLWLTYIKPIIIDGEVRAVIVIDFSLSDHKKIIKSLNMLDKTFEIAIVFAVFILFVILFFSYIDNKRSKDLEDKNIQIQNFNKTLQEKIDQEVEKNRQKDQQLFQQSRLAQMGEMIGMIAHQWRQPLTAISATSGAINMKAQLNKLNKETAIELSDKISSYAQHLSSTIDDFREFFKPNKEKKEITYNELVKSVLSIIEESIKNKNITLVKELNSDTIFYTYPNEIKQVILNLIKNAEDVLLENKVKDPAITITTKDNILSVSDNGGGVPKDIIKKIFDPYFSTKTKKDGTGLGLYMSKTIIEEHCGGNLSVSNITTVNEDSKSLDGAVFTIKLGVNND